MAQEVEVPDFLGCRHHDRGSGGVLTGSVPFDQHQCGWRLGERTRTTVTTHNHANTDHRADENTALTSMQQQLQAWKVFGAEAVHMMPVLQAHLAAVTRETERAALELMVHLRVLVANDGASRSRDSAHSVSQAVMAMQFQDITRQKIEHVTHGMEQLKRHLQALLKGPLNDEVKKDIAACERLELRYTSEEERRLHQTTLKTDYGEPVPTGLSDDDPDSVTLF